MRYKPTKRQKEVLKKYGYVCRTPSQEKTIAKIERHFGFHGDFKSRGNRATGVFTLMVRRELKGPHGRHIRRTATFKISPRGKIVSRTGSRRYL